MSNARSVVAERVLLTADCRHTDDVQLASMQAQLLALFARVAEQGRLGLQTRNYWSVLPTHFPDMCTAPVRAAEKAFRGVNANKTGHTPARPCPQGVMSHRSGESPMEHQT